MAEESTLSGFVDGRVCAKNSAGPGRSARPDASHFDEGRRSLFCFTEFPPLVLAWRSLFPRLLRPASVNLTPSLLQYGKPSPC